MGTPTIPTSLRIAEPYVRATEKLAIERDRSLNSTYNYLIGIALKVVELDTQKL